MRTLGRTNAQVSILAFGAGSRFLMYKEEDKALEAVGIRLQALVPARDVRRRVRAAPDRRSEPARGGRLPFRADDVDRVELALGIAEPGEQLAHSLEPEAVFRPRAERLKPISIQLRASRSAT